MPIATCMPFDCVIKALKFGRKCARPGWEHSEGTKDYIYINEGSIWRDTVDSITGLVVASKIYHATSEEMLATDWIIPD